MTNTQMRQVDDMKERVRKEREAAQEARQVPDNERLRLRYISALRSLNRMTEREAGELLHSASHRPS